MSNCTSVKFMAGDLRSREYLEAAKASADRCRAEMVRGMIQGVIMRLRGYNYVAVLELSIAVPQ